MGFAVGVVAGVCLAASSVVLQKKINLLGYGKKINHAWAAMLSI